MDSVLRQRTASLRPARTSTFVDRLQRLSAASATAVVDDEPAHATPDAAVSVEPSDPAVPRAPRKTSSATAYITFEDLSAPLVCRVVNMSATGARLMLTPGPSDVIIPPRDLPERLTLIFRVDRAQVDCIIQWRSPREIGVRFVSATRHSAARPALRAEPVLVGASRFASRKK